MFETTEPGENKLKVTVKRLHAEREKLKICLYLTSIVNGESKLKLWVMSNRIKWYCISDKQQQHNHEHTLRASPSGTFLQTLPLKGHSLSPRSCPPTLLAPSSFVKSCFTSTEITRTVRDGEPRTATSSFTQLSSSVIASKHARKHEAHPPWVKKNEEKKRVPSRFKRFWCYFSWRKQHGQL